MTLKLLFKDEKILQPIAYFSKLLNDATSKDMFFWVHVKKKNSISLQFIQQKQPGSSKTKKILFL
jgi:hypothetical protein